MTDSQLTIKGSQSSGLHKEVGDLDRWSRLAISKKSMALSLSQEVKDRLDLMAPAIVFFALPMSQQINMLPTLRKEQKYDFSQGDLITSNALEVLLTAYANCLNNLLNGIVVMVDELRNQEIEILNDLINGAWVRSKLMKAIEVTATVDEKGSLSLDQPVAIAAHRHVSVIILYSEVPLENEEQDPDDTPLEEVKASLRRSLEESKPGQRIPIAQMWDGIDA